MLRAYKYRIYPTAEQKVMLAKTFGCCRYVYNWVLEQKEKVYKDNKRHVSKNDAQYLVRHELRDKSAPWIKEVSSKAIEYAVDDLFSGYDNYFAGRAKKPMFHNKKGRQHFRDRSTYPTCIKADFEHGLISIPKIKNIFCMFHRRFVGNIKQVGVELLPSGRYFISVLVEDMKPEPSKPTVDEKHTIGIDTGLKHFAVLSDGQVFEPTHYGKNEKRKLKLLQRRLRKKKKDSRQFKVYKFRIARLHEHIANKRQDHIHKITHYLAYENQATTICVEDLNVKGMRNNKNLRYDLDDACLSKFYRQLEYKCKWAGKNYVKIGRWEPSSKTCSHCGYVNKNWSRRITKWRCPECGTQHERDLNAAINIKNIGLSLNKALPLVRRKVTPVEQPLVDDRS